MDCNEVVKRLQIISRVLNWVVGVFDDNSGRIPDTKMLKFVDRMDYIFFTKELWKIEHWQYHLSAPKSECPNSIIIISGH